VRTKWPATQTTAIAKREIPLMPEILKPVPVQDVNSFVQKLGELLVSVKSLDWEKEELCTRGNVVAMCDMIARRVSKQ
jgi:hypothetical protein